MPRDAPGLPELDPDTRRVAILHAAAGVFLRYGYRKTSMDDLARAADLSRQGLYLHFPNKEALFRESVVLLTTQRLQAARAALDDDAGTIEARILAAFTSLVTQGDGSLILPEQHAELIVSATEIAGPIVAAFDAAFLDHLARTLRTSDVAAAWKADGISAKDLARHLVAVSHGIKPSLRTLVDFREQMRVAIRLVCRAHG